MLTDETREVNGMGLNSYFLSFKPGFAILILYMSSLGRYLILLGILFVIAGVVTSWNIHIPWLGRLPGDISIKKENFSFYFPVTTCLLISAVLTLVFYLLRK